MQDRDRAMLTSLLGLKVRREQTIRTELIRLSQQEKVLDDEKFQLTNEQRGVWQEWQACSESQGVLDQTELVDLKERLAHYFQQDQMIIEQLAVIKTQWDKLQLARAEQQALLRKTLLEQEKLTYLLEEMKYEASKTRR